MGGVMLKPARIFVLEAERFTREELAGAYTEVLPPAPPSIRKLMPFLIGFVVWMSGWLFLSEFPRDHRFAIAVFWSAPLFVLPLALLFYRRPCPACRSAQNFVINKGRAADPDLIGFSVCQHCNTFHPVSKAPIRDVRSRGAFGFHASTMFLILSAACLSLPAVDRLKAALDFPFIHFLVGAGPIWALIALACALTRLIVRRKELFPMLQQFFGDVLRCFHSDCISGVLRNRLAKAANKRFFARSNWTRTFPGEPHALRRRIRTPPSQKQYRSVPRNGRQKRQDLA
jgi:hypothetical protein